MFQLKFTSIFALWLISAFSCKCIAQPIELTGGPSAKELSRLAKVLDHLHGSVRYKIGDPHVTIELPQASDDDLLRLPTIVFPLALNLQGSDVTDAGMKTVAKLSNLLILNLGHTKVGDSGILELRAANGLTCLYLEKTQITDKAIETLAQIEKIEELRISSKDLANLEPLTRLKKLKSLQVSGLAVEDDSLKKLAGLRQLEKLWLIGSMTEASIDHLPPLQRLSHLGLEGILFSDGVFEKISSKLDKLSSLSIIRAKKITGNEIHRLTNIESLEFSNCAINDKCILAMGKLNKLKTLILLDTDVTFGSLKDLSLLKNLSVLCLNADIGDDGLRKICKLANLNELRVWSKSVTFERVDASCLAKLKTLDVIGSAVGDAGVNSIIEIPNLEQLELELTKVALASTKFKNKLQSLKYLNLSSTKLGDDGLKQIALLPELRTLLADDTMITFEANVSPDEFRQLRMLTVGSSRVSDQGLKKIAAIKGLYWLDIRGIRATADVIGQLRKALSSTFVFSD